MKPPHPSEVASYPTEDYQRAFMIWIVWHIRTWKDGYYNKDGSGVDDATYDLWWANLLAMEEKYPHLVVESSPTAAVGAPT